MSGLSSDFNEDDFAGDTSEECVVESEFANDFNLFEPVCLLLIDGFWRCR